MQNVSIENGNFLNVKIDGDKNLPKVNPIEFFRS